VNSWKTYRLSLGSDSRPRTNNGYEKERERLIMACTCQHIKNRTSIEALKKGRTWEGELLIRGPKKEERTRIRHTFVADYYRQFVRGGGKETIES